VPCGSVPTVWALRLQNDLDCVGWGVKLYSLTHPLSGHGPSVMVWVRALGDGIPSVWYRGEALVWYTELPRSQLFVEVGARTPVPYGVGATFRGTVSHQKNMIKQPFNLTAQCHKDYFPVFAFTVIVIQSDTVTRFCKLLSTVTILSGGTCLKFSNSTTPLHDVIMHANYHAEVYLASQYPCKRVIQVSVIAILLGARLVARSPAPTAHSHVLVIFTTLSCVGWSQSSNTTFSVNTAICKIHCGKFRECGQGPRRLI